VQEDPPAEVSVFKLTAASASDPKLVAARNGVKRLRTVRTPTPRAARPSGLRASQNTLVCVVPQPLKPVRALARRQLRHPHLLQFKDSMELEADKGGITLYLVTEPVQPLSTLLQELRLAGTQRCGATRCLQFAWLFRAAPRRV
jgi:SCY1-like protein 1